MKAKGTWNAGNPAVKRILKEAKEMEESPCREFVARPLEENVFEWLFTLRGPDETEYENGFYRGRIILQSNYPFAPPDIELLTPNGRFELNKKICLSISSYHPENWHPTWGIKTVLHALREFMSTPGNNAIGAIEYSKEKRRQLARESHDFICPVLKVPITEDIDLLNNSPPSADSTVPKLPPTPAEGTKQEGTSQEAEQTVSAAAALSDVSENLADGAQADSAEPTVEAAKATETPEDTPEVQQPEAAPAAAPRPHRQHPPAAGPVIVISESALNKCIHFVTAIIVAILVKKVVMSDWMNFAET